MCNPTSLKGLDVVLSLLGVNLTGDLVLGGTVQDGEDRPFLLVSANPEHIGLNGLIEVLGFVGGRWSRLVRLLVSKA